MPDAGKFLLIAFITSEVEKMVRLLDLTPPEIEILQLILTGGTNKAIASECCIMEKTVEFHLNHIYTKKISTRHA